MKKLISVICAAMVALYAVAGEVTVTSVTAQQRTPGSRFVDIDVTLSGTTGDVVNTTCIFTATDSTRWIGLPVEHITQVGSDVCSGTTWTRRYVWDAVIDVGVVNIDEVSLAVWSELPLGDVDNSSTATTNFALDCRTVAGEVTVTAVAALQRYPGSRFVDITVTFAGITDDVATAECTFVATNSATHVELPVVNIAQNGTDSGSGTIWTRRFVWNVAADIGEVKINDIELAVKAEIPSDGVRLWENGPYWAECNVGATEPEEDGYCFWWGDTIGYEYDGESWNAADGSQTGFSFSADNCPTYGFDKSQLQSLGYIDESGNLVAAYDAATVHLGASWRMPTAADFNALISNCTSTWTMTNGVYGCLVTGTGAFSSRSIFLPAAGEGYYWSSSIVTPDLYDDYGYYYEDYYRYTFNLTFSSYYFDQCYNGCRYDGKSVRPLRGFAGISAVAATTHFPVDCQMASDVVVPDSQMVRGVVTVTSITAQQRAPGSRFVDITVTLSGAERDVADVECRFAAVNSTTRASLNVAHISQVGYGTCTRQFVWDAVADVGTVRIDDIALTVRTVSAGVPSGCVQLWENGPYWAECNVGATCPEEQGYYFWWGDTVGYTYEGGGWSQFYDEIMGSSYSSGMADVSWRSNDGSYMSGSPFDSALCPTYGKNISQLMSFGYTDSTGSLVAAHDAATVHLGAPWRMPTRAEWDALSEHCTITRMTRNYIDGLLVKGKGDYASESIFLPACGYGDESNIYYKDYYSNYYNGYYWSSTMDSDYSDYAYSDEGSFMRYCGLSVRPLQECDYIPTVPATTHFALDCQAVSDRVVVTDVIARQRYPWNGLVDITVTLSGTAEDIAKVDCAFAATNFTTQTELPMENITSVCDDQDYDGQIYDDPLLDTVVTRRYIWDASADIGDVKIEDVELTVLTEMPLDGVQLWENGPYWAECNVGAATSDEYGYYFGWGDTVGCTYDYDRNSWILSDGTDYYSQSSDSPYYSITQCDYSQLQSLGYVDATGNLAAAYDAATAQLGAPWRMPTYGEWNSLINHCNVTWTTQNGVYGYLVTGNDEYASNSIFLPAAGYGYGNNLNELGSGSSFWSSTPCRPSNEEGYWGYYNSWAFDAYCGYYLYLSGFDLNRGYLRSVRPVRGYAKTSTVAATMHLTLDCRTGTRVAGATEHICFSPEWEIDDANATVTVSLDGVAVTNTTGSGTFEWVPTENGTYQFTHAVYNGGVQVGETLSASFVVDSFNPEPPVIVPASGTIFGSSLTVNITCPSADTTIRYTTDGTTPTANSPEYDRFKVYHRTTVKAVAFFANGAASEVTTAEYAKGQCDDPVILPADGTTFYRSNQEVSIAWSGTDGTVRYTLDGNDPTANSAVYEGPFTVSKTTTVKAKAFGNEYFDSSVATSVLTRAWEQVATPVISARESFTGTKSSTTPATITCATDDATIRYTLDGSTPNSHSTKYTGVIDIADTTTIKAIAFKVDSTTSDMASFTVTKIRLQSDDPVISPADGTTFYHSNQEVFVSREINDGVLRFTLDGTDPTDESTVYIGPFTISATTTVITKVFGDEYLDSNVVTARLTRVWEQVPMPVITVPPSFSGEKAVATVVCALDGAVIFYTLDGSEPTLQATEYTGSIDVTGSFTIRAIAVKDDYIPSEVATASVTKVWCIGDAMNDSGREFTTDATTGWVRDTDVSRDGIESMRSGALENSGVYGAYNTSSMSTTVSGRGTVSFWWKASCESDDEYEWDHGEFRANGEVQYINGMTDWQEVTYTFNTDGNHEICWVYLKDDFGMKGQDCIWVDQFTWTPSLVNTETQTTATPVPYSWLEKYKLASGGSVNAEAYESAAKALAANGKNTVEECYVAGLEPIDPDAEFIADIRIVNGNAEVIPVPNLNTNGIIRVYTVKGKASLTDGEEKWASPVNNSHRFYKIEVGMPVSNE